MLSTRQADPPGQKECSAPCVGGQVGVVRFEVFEDGTISCIPLVLSLRLQLRSAGSHGVRPLKGRSRSRTNLGRIVGGCFGAAVNPRR